MTIRRQGPRWGLLLIAASGLLLAACSSGGKAQANGNSVVMTFDDGRIERWSDGGAGVMVEHWFPASHYPSRPAVLGRAKRAP